MHQVGDLVELNVKLRCQKVKSVSVLPFAPMKQLCSQRNVFQLNLICIFQKIYPQNSSFIKNLDHKKNLKKTRIKLYNTLALPVLLYVSETWTIKARDARRITAADMKYMRRTAGCTWIDYKTNTQIAKELKITPILDKLLEYKRNWIQHVNRMPRNRLRRVM